MQTIQTLQARPAWSGIFTLPRIVPEVPTVLTRAGDRGKLLARFVRAAQEVGVTLPKGDFASIEEVAAAQWQHFVSTTFDSRNMELLSGRPRIEVTDEKFLFWIDSQQVLNVFQEKPVIEELEKTKPGLGWFVHGVISRGHGHGQGLYDMEVACYYGLPCFHHDLDEFTDRAYAQWILIDQGDEPAEITEKMIEEMREQYGYWPSDVLETLGGHGHLMHAPGCEHPLQLKPKDVRAWVQANRKHRLCGCVHAALNLSEAWRADKERVFRFDIEGSESIGAPAILTWDDPALLLELIQHHEENIYNGGEGYEAYAAAAVPLDATDGDLRSLARATVTYFNNLALLAEALSYFPVWEEDDET